MIQLKMYNKIEEMYLRFDLWRIADKRKADVSHIVIWFGLVVDS
jgi:hypothetical protein